MLLHCQILAGKKLIQNISFSLSKVQGLQLICSRWWKRSLSLYCAIQLQKLYLKGLLEQLCKKMCLLMWEM